MGKERRQFERIESLVNIRYTSKEDAIRGSSLTKDFSESGIGMPVDGKIPEGEVLNLEIALNENGQSQIQATAKVVWSKKNFEHWKSRYSSGLRFQEIAPNDKDALMKYVKRHRWVKSDFERALEENKVPILGRRGEF